ncbi:MAG: hypothetical protein EXR85_10400 [Xanthomonadales bacterium]|nr:hypothetical protein [Xanthomonadales bacterium]
MNIRVHQGYFRELDQAVAEIAAQQLYPVEMLVPPVSNESHWHSFSTRIYILEGELTITDHVLKQAFTAGPGALVEVPQRVLHSEFSAQGYKIIAGMTADPAGLSGPIDLDPSLL